MLSLIRYWFEFDASQSNDAKMMPWVGVTAWTNEDAELLMRERLFGGGDLPAVSRMIAAVRITDLDEKHVQRHMAPPNERGIWYPRGFA